MAYLSLLPAIRQIQVDKISMFSSEANDDQAYGQLALAMAWGAFGFAETAEKYGLTSAETPADTDIFFHNFTSNFENIAYALKELGILKDIKGTGCYFTFTCDMADVPRLAIENRGEGPDFHSMLHYFCYHYADFNTEYYGLNFHVDTPFCPQRGMSDVLDALAEIGYAQRLGVGSVVQVKNPSLSTIWSNEYVSVHITESDGYLYVATGFMSERMQFITGHGSPCFIWTERMRTIPADGMVWDELKGLDVPG